MMVAPTGRKSRRSAEPQPEFQISLVGPRNFIEMELKRRSLALIALTTMLAGVGAGVLCATMLAPEQQWVAWPTAAIALIGIMFILIVGWLNQETPAGEIGVYYVSAILLYALFPLSGYLLRGMVFTQFNDPRLYYYQPTPQEMGVQGWRYVAYLLPCAFAYLWVRGKRRLVPHPLGLPQPGVMRIVLLVGSAMQLFLLAYSQYFGVHAESYAEQVEASAKMAASTPLWLLQIALHMTQALLTLKMLVLVFLFASYRKYRFAIWIWLAIELILAITQLGARSPLVFLLITALFLYHRQVKPIRFGAAVSLVLCGLVAYQLFGFIRSFGMGSVGGLSFMTGASEFESHFGTGFDIVRRKSLGSLPAVPLQVYVADFLALIPSQILPFPKHTGASWYLNILNAQGTGYGLAFGAIAESVVGLGWPDLAMRGALLGAVFALVHRWYIRRSASFWGTLIYIYLVVNSYNSFRASSFYWLATLWLEVLPLYLLIRLLTPSRPADQ